MNHTEFKPNRKAMLAMAVLAAIAAMPVQAATISVNTTTDVIADDGLCSLREAVIAANTNTASGAVVGECVAGEVAPVVDVISLPANAYTLSLSGLDEVEDPATVGVLDVLNTPDPTIGDLDIVESVTITGAGSGTTTIQWADQADRDRIFHVNPATGTVNVTIAGVKLTQGQTKEVDLGIGPPTEVPGGLLPTNYWLRRAGGGLAVGPAAAVVLVDPNKTGTLNSEGQGGSNKPGDEGETNAAVVTITLNDVIVDDNQADGDGGGIYTAAKMTATGVIVSNNDSITNGGGVYNEGNTSITSSTISGNIAEGGGGVFLTGSQPVTIKGTTLSGNRAVGGGAVSGRSGVTVNMVNSTLSGNLAQDVGAGFYHNGPASLNFVTIANNVTGADSDAAGSGINTFQSGSVLVAVKNVLLAGNKKGWLPVDYKTDPFPDTAALIDSNCGATGGGTPNISSSGNNLSSDTTCTSVLNVFTDLNDVDPLIGPLADNNAGLTGTTLTHALLAGSPALSAGAVDASVTTDQRGEARETPPDIGAFELDNITEGGGGGGGGGGGCAVGGDGRLDPTMPAMLAAALAVFGWRRRTGK